MENKHDLEYLKADPIFAMSLSSKELFHSNFWAWLFERNIEYAKIFFPKIQNIELVEREKGNRDVSIWQSKKKKPKKQDDYNYNDVLVIENKFKSIPTEEQLMRYQEDIEAPKTTKGQPIKNAARKFCHGILTGLTEPDFIYGMKKWTFLSYDEIGKGIVAKADELEKEDVFVHEIIVRYGNLIQNLQKILLDASDHAGDVWNTGDRDRFLAVRLHDIFGKIMADKLAAYLKKKLSLKPKVNGYELEISSYYSRGGEGVDVRYVNRENNLTLLGVQIEPKQYRICAQWHVYINKINRNLDPKKTILLFESLKKVGWFVDYEENQKKMICFHADSSHKTSLSESYGGYGAYDGSKPPQPYTFLYQYWNLNNTPFDEICTNIQRDMECAYEILKDYNDGDTCELLQRISKGT